MTFYNSDRKETRIKTRTSIFYCPQGIRAILSVAGITYILDYSLLEEHKFNENKVHVSWPVYFH